MKTRRDITPLISLIRAFKNQDWTAREAISELVDNSLGEGRGNASRVDITWNPGTRELSILDNGRGMEDVGDLFQLGKGVGRTPRDIGQYGSGGTMALLWLADEVTLWTKRNGSMSGAHVDWSALRDWAIDQSNWSRASAANTPGELLAEPHGTFIRLKVPTIKKFTEREVRTALTNTYAPGLRAGRRINWITVDRRGQEHRESLAAPAGLPEPQEFSFVLEYEGKHLEVRGEIGLDPELTRPADSQIAIGFAHRIISRTNECYSAPDGSVTYIGVGVTGWVDLGEGWQEYLSTTKTAVTHAPLWDALMGHLFGKLEPLLHQTDEAAEMLQLDLIALNLAVQIEGAFNLDVVPARREKPEYTWQVKGKGAEVPEITPGKGEPDAAPEEDEEATQKPRPATRIWIQFGRTSDELGGGLYEVQDRSDALIVFLAKDHDYVREARTKKSPVSDMLLASMVVHAVAAAILEFPAERQRKVMQRNLFRLVDDAESQTQKLAIVSGHLLKNARSA